MAQAAVEFPLEQASESLPRGLRWRGDVLWINKKIEGKRYQFSTGCTELSQGKIAFEEFLLQHGVKKSPGSGRRINTDRPELPKGLYWKGNVIWLSRAVDGKHYNVSTGTSDPRLAGQFLANFDLKAFKGEKLGVIAKAKITFEQIANRYLEQSGLNGLRANSITRYNAVRDHFVEFLSGRGLATTDAKNLTPALVEDYKLWRSTTPLNRNGQPVKPGEEADASGAAPKTLQLEVQTIGTFFRHAVRLRLVDENPVERVRSIRLISKTPVYLDEAEIKAFLKAADEAFRKDFGPLLYQILFTYPSPSRQQKRIRYLRFHLIEHHAFVHCRNKLNVRVGLKRWQGAGWENHSSEIGRRH